MSQINSLSAAMDRIGAMPDPGASDYVRAISMMIDDLYSRIDVLQVTPSIPPLSDADFQMLQSIENQLNQAVRSSNATSQSILAVAQAVEGFRGTPA
ncbi:hypothetical protein [Paraburkholderia caribensis]|uniref:hypothetical protein n=1 Tax=Paraburkholderia caribensis TaxID=75105 RepID=UPI0007A0467D|nr:hypothetical protein [Paraburkholderia caribensis]